MTSDWLPTQVTELAQKYSRSADVTLAKYANELLVFREHMDVMKAVLPVDASCEDLETDRSLSFLNGYVQVTKPCWPLLIASDCR